MTPAPSRAAGALAVLAVLLAGCPQLETPLATVTGRIVGASARGYAYPFGRPDLKVLVAADGTWRIEGVPTSVPSVVLFDGSDRAELVAVQLAGGAENRVPDREASVMPLAATVIAAAIPDGGAVASGASYTVTDTDLSDLVQLPGSESVALGPLPAGRFELQVRLAGFTERRSLIDVVAGATTPFALPLEIDVDQPERGCEATLACESGLYCNAADGRCYQCTSAGGCGVGELCDLGVGLCKPISGPATALCSACAGPADCASGVCVAGTPSGYCSWDCSAGQACPAGFACSGSQCVAPAGCSDWLQTMGAPCVDDDDCTELAGGWCEHAPEAPGACTATCAVDADCQVGTGTASAFVCRAGGLLGSYCAP